MAMEEPHVEGDGSEWVRAYLVDEASREGGV